LADKPKGSKKPKGAVAPGRPSTPIDIRELVTLDEEGAKPRADATAAETMRERKDMVGIKMKV
jgi:hypothetical protein